MKFCVTIDVEPDCGPGWQYSSPLTFRGVSTGIKERLAPLFDRLDVRPVYLVNNVVMEHGPSAEILSAQNCELGAHLHPDFIAPEKIHEVYDGKRGLENLCLLPPDSESGKIKAITDLFKSRFGKAPVSFRAGRFSASAHTIKCLAANGYKVDTSVTPHVRWDDKTRAVPVDFSSAPEQPYFPKETDICLPGGSGPVLEVPVSIMPMRSFLRKQIVWLRPGYSDASSAARLVKSLAKRYGDRTFFNIMFHNVEVVPGLSPYTHSEEDCAAHMNAIANLVRLCRSAGAVNTTLENACGDYAGK